MPVFTGTLGLRWDNCLGDGGVQNQAFACDVNTGANVLVASFVPAAALQGVSGIESRIDITIAGTSVPPWWDLRNAGACRQASLTSSAVENVAGPGCIEWGSGSQIGLVAAYGTVSSNRRSVQFSAYLPVGTVDFEAGQEYFAYSLILNHQKTVGSGSCTGCSVGACLTLQYIEFDLAPSGTIVSLNPTAANTNWLATWQSYPGGAGACEQTTAVTRSTWGALKQLYR